MTIQDHSKLTTPMLIIKLGQHQITLGKPWMRKHDVILDMRNDRLSFWPSHCQHTKELHATEPHAKPRVEETCAEEPHASGPMTILKQPSVNKLPESLLLYLLPNTQGVSKVANTPEAVKPQEKKKKPSTIPEKPKPNAKDKPKARDETNSKDKETSVEQAN